MKNVIKYIPVVLFTITFLVGCRSVKSMDDFYSKYNEKATVIPVPNFAVRWANKATGGSPLFQHLKSSKVFILSNVGDLKQRVIMKDLNKSANGDHFNKLVQWNKNNNNIKVYYLEKNGNVDRLLLGVNGFENVLILDAKLNITQDILETLLNKINTNDIEFLKEILKK